MIAGRLCSVALLCATSAHAATIVEREVDLHIVGRELHERERMVVVMESAGDLESWRSYPVFVDDHIALEEATIEVLDATGKVVESVPRRKLREETSVGFGLHSSDRALVAELPVLAVGQRLRVDVTRRITPLFCDTWVPFVLDYPQNTLKVTVRGGGETLRWAMQDAAGVVQQREDAGTLVFEGSDIPARLPPDHAARFFAVVPRLLIAWDGAAEWPQIGQWFNDLVKAVPRESPQVAALAHRLSEGHDATLDQLVALADYARTRIRYEAVEVGEGAWIPTPAAEVVERGWGDCKDKSLLLVDLLRAVGIPAHLVLIHNGRDGRLVAEFPSLLGVNHCIVAVQAEAVSPLPDAVAVDGLIFLDPTMDRGDALWLSPHLHDQWALVAAGDASRLVRLPVRYENEGRQLQVDGVVSATGDLAASAMLRVTGSRAVPWLRGMDTEEVERLQEAVVRSFQLMVPGAVVSSPNLRAESTGVPSVVLTARLDQSSFLRGRSVPRVRPSRLSALPEPRELEDRSEACVLTPGVHLSSWRVVLPEGVCMPAPSEELFGNDIGELRDYVRSDEHGRLEIGRRVELRETWIDTAELAELAELSAAENRSNRHSLRLTCGDEDASDTVD